MLRLHLLVAVITLSLRAQTPAELPPPSRTIALYETVAPGSETWDWTEYTYVTFFGNTVTRNVVHPTLQYYPADPAKATGTAVIIAPGGGFTDLMIKYEGVRNALALNALGIDVFILKYRLIYTDPTVPLPKPGETPPPRVEKRAESGEIIWGPQKGQNIYELAHADARQAIAWIRAHAAEFHLQPDRLGIIGFSAGGFVSLALALDEAAYRPDFAGVIYGPDQNERAILADAPPLFIAVSADDTWSAPRALNLFKSWREAGRPTELHIFQTGGHGFLNRGSGEFFLDRFTEWMRINGWLPPGPEGTGPKFR